MHEQFGSEQKVFVLSSIKQKQFINFINCLFCGAFLAFLNIFNKGTKSHYPFTQCLHYSH